MKTWMLLLTDRPWHIKINVEEVEKEFVKLSLCFNFTNGKILEKTLNLQPRFLIILFNS